MQNTEFSSLEIALELFGAGKSEPSNEFAAIARILIQDRDAAWNRFLKDHDERGKK